MKWIDTTQTPPSPSFELRHGDVCVSVNPSSDDRRWQYFTMSVGRHTDRPDSESMEKWPREAVAIARRALADFAAELDEAEKCADASG